MKEESFEDALKPDDDMPPPDTTPLESNVFEDVPSEEVPFDVIVDQVIAGEWGVGQTRRLNLAKAGHDPNEVQREIVRRANSK